MEDAAHAEGGALPKQRKKGGLKTIPFIISNEIFEKVATFGLQANMILYLTRRYHMTAATGAMVIYIWGFVSHFMPIFGAFLSDAYLGRFQVITIGSSVCLCGMCLLCVTAMLPAYRRTPGCTVDPSSCSLEPWQLPLLFTSFVLMSIGSGGIRPCTLAFGADQLDKKDNGPQNVRMLQTFFNWYYTVLGISMVAASTVIVYIQEKKGWVVGFGVPVLFMATALTLLLVGSPLYVKVDGDKSVLVGLAQVIVALFKNRRATLPPKAADASCYHNKIGVTPRVPSNKLRFLNKACAIRNQGEELKPDGSAYDPWTLCTVQQVENLKATIRVLPIWSTGFIPAVVIGQQSFPVLQASTMDRWVGSNLQIPAASFNVFAIVTLTIWVALYDRLLVRHLSRLTGQARGLSLRQRMGIGQALMAAAMAIAMHMESVRRVAAIAQGVQDKPSVMVHMSAMWLVPQHCLIGLAEAFSIIGQIEFYYSEFPKSMSSIGVSLLALGFGVGDILGSVIIAVVHAATRRNGRDSWVASNLNRGHYDYYYLVLALLNVANLFYFVGCSWAYGEEGQSRVREEEAPEVKEDQKCQV